MPSQDTKNTNTDKDNVEIPAAYEAYLANCGKLYEIYQKLLQEVVTRPPEGPETGMVNAAIEAYGKWWAGVLSNPYKHIENTYDMYHDWVRLMANASLRTADETLPPAYEGSPYDRRFKDESWSQHLAFNVIQQSYLLFSHWAEKMAGDVDELNPNMARKVQFYTKQWTEALSPSNFAATNPEVWKETLESNGENLVRGMQNLLEDMRRSKDILDVSMTDTSAFEVGSNIACTPGQVVFQNELVQLIQYAPSTKQVYTTPILIVSPWINKYYILDLQEKNSFVKWLVDQGHTVFITSWVNPTSELADTQFEDYIAKGSLAALEAVREITGAPSVNTIGYCLGGTLMACTLAYLKVKKRQDWVQSITYLTTMTDFSDPGEMSVFIDDWQLSDVEEKMAQKGVFDGKEMAFIFRMLRANDLFWSFTVNNYLLGRTPMPFDLLYWNCDSTALPAAMCSYYLRNMYQENLLATPKALTMLGVPMDLTVIDTPTYMLSTREDHIAPWRTTYAATQFYKGDIRFVLSGSGHVAGVINPPVKNKYGYWVSPKKTGHYPVNAENWLAEAKEHAGSWWNDWQSWVTQHHAGDKVSARKLGSQKHKALEPAPGSYVRVRTDMDMLSNTVI